MANKKSKEYNFTNVEKYLTNHVEAYRSKSTESLPDLNLELDKTTIKIEFGVSETANLYDLVTFLAGSMDGWYTRTYGGVSSRNLDLMLTEDKQYSPYLTVTLDKSPSMDFYHSRFGVDKTIKIRRENGRMTEHEARTILALYKKGNPLVKEVKSAEDYLLELGVAVYDSEKMGKLGWNHLAGYETAKQEIKDTIILPLKHPEVYDGVAKNTRRFESSIRPRAVLFEGPPGTGKTTSARIIASKANAKLIYVPIESIMTKWYGESSRNLSQIFDRAHDLGDVILFLDEIDSLAGNRENIHEATRRVLSVLLRKLDGFTPEEKVITIGATNRMGDLDPALLRRFDATINFPLPNVEERAAIYSVYAKQLSSDEISKLASISEDFSGSDIKNVCVKTERRWASCVINKTAKGIAPALEDYVQILSGG